MAIEEQSGGRDAGFRTVLASRLVHLALTIMTAAATFAALPAGPAGASSTLPTEPPDPIAAAEAYHDYLKAYAPGAVEPLVRYDTLDSPAPDCGRDRTPRFHAILVGASTAGELFGTLTGPDNDVELLATSLKSRGVPAADIDILVRADASRARLATAFTETIAEVGCGDRVLFHFGGNAGRPLDMLRAIIPDSLRAEADQIPITDFWNADFFNQDHEPTQAIRWAERAGLFLALNQQADGVYELLSVIDLSDFTSVLRNRNADVVVTLDTSYASLADIAGRQEKAGDSAVWSVETSGKPDSAQPYVFAPPVRLLPNRGAFAAFYSSVGDSHSVELGFPNADGTKQLTPTDPIVITSPAPKRGAAVIDAAEIVIKGVVNWSAPAKAVLIGGRVSALAQDGSFSQKVTLKAGLNTIEVVALTADGRTHETRLELVFEGDMAKLEGEGRRYAVIIANETYDRARTGFGALSTPFEDADAVAAILTARYGFQTEASLPDGKTIPLVLKDATRRDIETVLYQIGLVAGEKDTVLIYYAGHGIYEERTTIAFWVPSDAEAGVPISYLSASTIAEAVQRMQANKVIVISDSCFSGALLRGGGESGEAIDQSDRERALMRLSQCRSRVLISSGNNEPVEDLGGAGHSVFARALLTGLEKMDYDAFSARELFDGYILQMVVANSDQEPQYRPIEKTGHEGGDIVFVRK